MQKVYLSQSHQSHTQKRKLLNANTRSGQEIHSSESETVQEDLPRLRIDQCFNSHKMQEMPRQEPALEETRDSEVT
jgi:hypothetical protein